MAADVPVTRSRIPRVTSIVERKAVSASIWCPKVKIPPSLPAKKKPNINTPNKADTMAATTKKRT